MSRSRVRASPDPSAARVPYVPQPESLILPDGPVSEGAAELLDELVHPRRHEGEATLIGVEADNSSEYSRTHEEIERLKRAKLPWWKTPSAWWLLILTPVTAIGMSATLAPRIEIYTMLACNVHKPEYNAGMDLRYLAIPYHRGDPSNFDSQSFPSLLSPAFHISQNEVNNGSIYFPNNTVSPFDATDPSNERNLCASDPVVQAAVAKLSTVMSLSMGILSCLTTAWWGAFSDRFGRTRVMGISAIGLLLTDFNFILVSFYAQRLPGNYWFLIAGPLLEGTLGGLTSAMAAIHAYVADCTVPGARSRVFSLALGLLFTGMAVGPTLGGLLIRVTHSTLSVFYAATALHLQYAILVWFIIPESLSYAQMLASRQLYADETLRDRAARDTPAVGLLVRLKRLFGFLSPLSVFIPEKVDYETNPLKANKRDWNLSLLAACYGLTVMIMGSYSYKFQYAASTFGWSSETISYWLSIVGASRAIYLTLMLPVLIKIFKGRSPAIQLPVESSEPLLPDSQEQVGSSSSSLRTSPVSKSLSPSSAKEVHSPSFDLGLARASLVIEILSYGLMGLASTAGFFTVFTVLGSFGAGFAPAVQSIALELYSRRGGTETGRLFGALSVVQALCSQILGPAIFGITYLNTVAAFPSAIFMLSVALVAISFLLMGFIHLPRETHGALSDIEGQTPPEIVVTPVPREETLVDIDGSTEEVGRGRTSEV